MVLKIVFRPLRAPFHRSQSRFYSNRNMMKLKERGMLQDIFPAQSAQEIVDLCNGSRQSVYAGFDPTASSLHVGNLFVLVNLMHWQRAGHQVIALVGGATGRIGDPSGRNKDREQQKDSVVERNVATISSMIRRLFDNHQKYFWKEKKDPLSPVRVLNNAEWYRELNAVDFVCDLGRNFRMGTMLSRSSVESRISSEGGMSFTEFAYQIFQAFDWLHLVKTFDCRFQVGGNDQMGNIMSGHELISRVVGKPVYGLTMPLITSETGDKYGKSGNNAVWLDSELTSPFELYQFLVRSADADVQNLLNFFTFMTPGEIRDIMIQHTVKPEKRIAQKLLAEKVTTLVHGEEGLASAARATSAVYDSSVETLSRLTQEELSSVFKGATQVSVLLRPGVTVKEMALNAKCFLSLHDADRIIKAGGLYVNHNRTTNPEEVLVPGVHILANGVSLVRVGKRNYWIIKWLE